MSDKITLGVKLRKMQNYFVKNEEKVFEEWLDAFTKTKETAMIVASMRGATEYTITRSVNPTSEIDSIPPLPSSEKLKEIEKKIGEKHGIDVKIVTCERYNTFSIIFSWEEEKENE